jgi:hypothetical protein
MDGDQGRMGCKILRSEITEIQPQWSIASSQPGETRFNRSSNYRSKMTHYFCEGPIGLATENGLDRPRLFLCRPGLAWPVRSIAVGNHHVPLVIMFCYSAILHQQVSGSDRVSSSGKKLPWVEQTSASRGNPRQISVQRFARSNF